MKRGALLESFAFLEVIKVCITRELDTDIHRSCRELERISHRGFVGEFVYVHKSNLVELKFGVRSLLVCTRQAYRVDHLPGGQRLYTAYMAEEAS